MGIDPLKEARQSLVEDLTALARKIVGTGRPGASGVFVHADEPSQHFKPLPGAHDITRYNTLARIHVNSDDQARAGTEALKIAEILEADWDKHQIDAEPRAISVDGSEVLVSFEL